MLDDERAYVEAGTVEALRSKGVVLVEGDGVPVVGIPASSCGTGQELVRVVMAMNVTPRWMGEARKHGQLIAQRLERLKTLCEGKLLALAVGEPGPILIGRILGKRHRDAIGKIKACQAPAIPGGRGGSCRGDG